MRRLAIVVGMALLLAGAQGAHASEWLVVRDGSSERVSIDTASLRREVDVVEFWAKVEFTNARPAPNGKSALRRLDHLRIICAKRTLYHGESVWYLDDRQVDRQRRDWEPTVIVPDSVSDAEAAAACAQTHQVYH
jgi:hypothetical protein